MKGHEVAFVCFMTKAVHFEICISQKERFFPCGICTLGRTAWFSQAFFREAQRISEKQFVEFTKDVSPEIVKRYAPQGINWQFISSALRYGSIIVIIIADSLQIKIAGNYKFHYAEFTTLTNRFVSHRRPANPLFRQTRVLHYTCYSIQSDPAESYAPSGHFWFTLAILLTRHFICNNSL